LYEVLAPPGPLGIVVDTTKDGPVIHSLKGTSTLLGLVGSGDLIVGLDDMDTRSMTAATLTRMMAKRSNQAERKITLLAVDN
jgi:C-terminal processing protease CtpA/Prc